MTNIAALYTNYNSSLKNMIEIGHGGMAPHKYKEYILKDFDGGNKIKEKKYLSSSNAYFIEFESSGIVYPNCDVRSDTSSSGGYCPPKETRRKDIKKWVKAKDLKMIKDEVKRYMTKELKKAARAEAGKLMSDIKQLKEDKKKLRSELTRLKSQINKSKEELTKMKKKFQEEIEEIRASLQEEREAVEALIEQHARKVLRYELIDV